MSVSYTCPNPDCGVTLKTPNRVAPGKSVKCPKCKQPFTPETEEEEVPVGPGTFKLADEPPPKRPSVTGTPKSAAPPTDPKKRFQDDDEDMESIKKGYAVHEESEAEKKDADKHKVKFGEIEDKWKKSARGPAMALLVTPTNLLALEGLLTCIGGLVLFVVGMWPLVFNDAAPSDEEVEDAIVTMILAMVTFGWGALICIGASQMQDLASYGWATAGAVMGVLPLLVGIYAIIMLQHPKVKAGFEESEGGPDDEDEDDLKKKDDEDEEADDNPKKGKSKR